VTSPDEHVEPVADQPTGGEPQETAAPHPGGRHADRAEHSFGDAAGEMADETEVESDRGTTGADAGSDTGSDADLAAADELILAQTALAERTLDLQRIQAEFLNYKRRVDRDRDLVRENATYSVLSGLLPVLDDIDRAREHGEVEGGFKAVADSLDRIVSGLGLTKFGAKGDEFDPNVHEALMHGHSSEVTTTTVDVVAQAGYRIGDRVVRAARVTVLDPES
jgi:molecular chaperone GrpE